MSRLSKYPTTMPDFTSTAFDDNRIDEFVEALDGFDHVVAFMNDQIESVAGYIADRLQAKRPERAQQFVGAEQALYDMDQLWDGCVVYSASPDYEAFADGAIKLIVNAHGRSTHPRYGQIARARWAAYELEARRQMYVLVGQSRWENYVRENQS